MYPPPGTLGGGGQHAPGGEGAGGANSFRRLESKPGTLYTVVYILCLETKRDGGEVALKGLSYEIDFENVDENGQILALTRAAAGF